MTHQIMLVELFHANIFFTGPYVPVCLITGPFSRKKPSIELHPGPPFNQMVSAFTGAPVFGLKKNFQGV